MELKKLCKSATVARSVARTWFDKQKWRNGTENYVEHRIRVGDLARGHQMSDTAITAGYLINICHKTIMDEKGLAIMGIPTDAVSMARVLSQPPDMTYADYIKRVISTRSPEHLHLLLLDIQDALDITPINFYKGMMQDINRLTRAKIEVMKAYLVLVGEEGSEDG